MADAAPLRSGSTMPAWLAASIGVHAGAVGAAMWVPGAAPWALGAVIANHVLITGAGLTPRSRWLGDNLTQLPPAAAARGDIAVTIDDGPDAEVTPRVLDLLDAARQRATFFCIADRVAAVPALAREIVRRGHSVQNHSACHRHNFSLLGPRGFEREIGRAQAIIVDSVGERPMCFRAPAGLRNPFLAPVLQRLDLRLVSWTRRGFDTREREPMTVLRRLSRGLAGGDILLLHDGNAARTARATPVVLDVLPPLFEAMRRHGLRSVTLPQALRATARSDGSS